MTRGFLGLDRRGWPGTIVVALVAAAIALGLPLVNRLVSADRPIPSGADVEVGRDISFTAGEGWSLDTLRSDRPADDREGTVVLGKGPLLLSVQTLPSSRPLPEEFGRLADEIRGAAGAQLFHDATPFTTAGGLEGIAGSYTAPATEGRFAVLRDGDTAVRVLAEGPPDALARSLDDLERMVDTLRVDPP